MSLDFAGNATRWLAEQPEGAVAIARQILKRRDILGPGWRTDTDYGTAHENGVICGMRLALSYLTGRPGDISQTGAEGFISAVEDADRVTAASAAVTEG